MKKLTFILGALICTATAFAGTGKIEVNPKGKIVTNGFADLGKMEYPSADNVILIDDNTYKTPDSKKSAFVNAIASGSIKSSKITATPAIIIVSGTVDLSGGKVSDTDHSYFDQFDPKTHERLHNDFMFDVGSNKTIIGINKAKVAYGGLRIKATATNKANNIIIRNITFWDAHGSTDYDTSIPEYSSKKASADQLSIEGVEHKATKASYDYVPENIWIDHCSFSDGICVDLKRNYNHDGALDAKCVHNMTVSYCEFTNHDKVTLTGSSDRFVTPEERQITFHNNYYHGVVQRMPRSRGCQIHIYNNVYDQIGTSENSGYSLGPGIASQFIVENNYFGVHANKILRYADKSKPGDKTLSKLYNKGNMPELSPSNSEEYNKHHVEEMPWKILYDYSLMSADQAKKTVPLEAGPVDEVVIDGKTYGN